MIKNSYQIASFKTTFSKTSQGAHPPQTPPAWRKHDGRQCWSGFDQRWRAIFDFQNLPPPPHTHTLQIVPLRMVYSLNFRLEFGFRNTSVQCVHLLHLCRLQFSHMVALFSQKECTLVNFCDKTYGLLMQAPGLYSQTAHFGYCWDVFKL